MLFIGVGAKGVIIVAAGGGGGGCAGGGPTGVLARLMAGAGETQRATARLFGRTTSVPERDVEAGSAAFFVADAGGA